MVRETDPSAARLELRIARLIVGSALGSALNQVVDKCKVVRERYS